MAFGGITMWGSTQLMGEFFGRRVDYPVSLFVALARDIAPGPFTEGGELDEPGPETGYLRAEIANDFLGFDVVDNIVTNHSDILFPACAASWGSVRYFAISDSPTEGNLYFYGDLGETIPTDVLDQIYIPSGTLDIVIGPIYGDGGGDVG